MRQRLSSHTFRSRALAAAAHYEGLQDEAVHGSGSAGEYARSACAHLGIGLGDSIDVERGRFERGKWIVTYQTPTTKGQIG